MRARQGHAGFDRHRVRIDVDLADAIELLEGEEELLAGGVRRLSADKAGVSALRDDAHAICIAKREKLGDFVNAFGKRHSECAAGVVAARLLHQRVRGIGSSDEVFFADDRRKAGEQIHATVRLRRSLQRS